MTIRPESGFIVGMLIYFIRILPAALLLAVALNAAPAGARDNTAALFRSGLTGDDPALVSALAAELSGYGYKVTEIDASNLCDAAALDPKRFDLLVLPNAGPLPAKAMSTIEAYLRGGGDIIALNAPLWQRALIKADGRWMTREDYERDRAPSLPENVLYDFSSTGADGWQRSSNDASTATTWQTADGPAAGQRALHVAVPRLTSWDTLVRSAGERPFPEGHTLTVFSAKGGPKTRQLSVEWTEKDGSRWIAVVPLTTEWRHYVLTPRDFQYWNSNPARGFPGDELKPENADRVAIGLALSHTTAVGPGPHEYWLGSFGTARLTPELAEILGASEAPKLDTLSPGYKFFDCHEVAKLHVRSDQVVVERGDLPAARVVRSIQPRASGGGFDKGRAWRWLPLIEARSGKGEWRGVPAAITLHADGPYKGGIWASFGVGDLDWYKSPAVLKRIGEIARWMRYGDYLLDGGANFYTYFEGQETELGARVVNLGDQPADLVTRVTYARADDGTQTRAHDRPVHVEPGSVQSASSAVTFHTWPEAGFTVTAELLREGKVIDRVAHDIHAWKPKAKKSFVTVKNGEFRLDGKRWRAHGINYMPSSGVATEDGGYFEQWLSARAYDPEAIQRDLEHIKDLGFNSISIFTYTISSEAQNLLDILRRADALGIKANVSLRPGTPMEFLWPQIGEIIKHYRLWENDTVFAYDLAWEPGFGTHDERKVWDRDWESWIIERYGSIANAEKDWGYAVPRDESGQVTNLFPEHFVTDGEWRVMTAAYRRFLDTLLYKKYGEARRLVRGIDPNHLVSFRMSETANPTNRMSGHIPYDFPYLAGAVDFLAPEAYGRIGDWDRVKPGWFQREYARWAAPTKPMIWAEGGVSTWDASRMANSPEALRHAATFYEQFYKLLIDSAADGVFFWYYPGGFRVGENSDYGVIEPDGTDREVTRVIRDYGPKFLAGPSLKPVNHWITIDRDAHPDGVAGIYDQAQAEFWNAIEAGQVPGLKTAGTGTDSCNSPKLAVGNTKPTGPMGPIGPIGPIPPLKYLDAAFDQVEVQTPHGNWTQVPKGGSVKVVRGKPVVARVKLTNLGESAWSTKPNCKVALLIGEKSVPLSKRVGHLETVALNHVILSPSAALRTGSAKDLKPVDVTLSLYAKGRGTFGERFKLTLVPSAPQGASK